MGDDAGLLRRQRLGKAGTLSEKQRFLRVYEVCYPSFDLQPGAARS